MERRITLSGRLFIAYELANHLYTTPNYLSGYEDKSNSEDEAIMELLSKIKDKKMKDMIMAQIIFASKMEED